MSEDNIERRLDLLSDLVDSLAKQELVREQRFAYDEADRRTHKFILFHLAARLGSDYARFEAHYEAVHRKCLAGYFDEVSKVSQGLAGQLDVRSLDAVDADDDLPRLWGNFSFR